MLDSTQTQTFTLPVTRGRANETMTFRNPYDLAELISHCSTKSHIYAIDNKGVRAITLKVNGQVRTWKRDAARIEIPVKYGLYEYATITAHDINRVLIPV